MTAFDSFLQVTETGGDDRGAFARYAAEGRRLAGLSLRDVAVEFRTAAGTVSRWENGHSAPSAIARREIIEFYRTRVRKIRDAASASVERSAATLAGGASAGRTTRMTAMGSRSR